MNKISALEAYKISAVMEDVSYKNELFLIDLMKYSLPRN